MESRLSNQQGVWGVRRNLQGKRKQVWQGTLTTGTLVRKGVDRSYSFMRELCWRLHSEYITCDLGYGCLLRKR